MREIIGNMRFTLFLNNKNKKIAQKKTLLNILVRIDIKF